MGSRGSGAGAAGALSAREWQACPGGGSLGNQGNSFSAGAPSLSAAGRGGALASGDWPSAPVKAAVMSSAKPVPATVTAGVSRGEAGWGAAPAVGQAAEFTGQADGW